MERERIRAVVGGRVQGVGFRYFVLSVARGLGLAGYVRNLPDGDVEVVAEGERDRLDALIARLNEGPPSSNVTEVHVERAGPPDEHIGFEVRY